MKIHMVTVMAVMSLAASPAARAEEANYEGGRGLLTLQGPSGMFINPTSGTLPEDNATLQFCVLFPNNESDVVGYGAMGSFGYTDALEIGGHGKYVDMRAADDSASFAGPLARLRLTKDEGMMPQASIGYYSTFGDEESGNNNRHTAFAALYKRLPIGDDSPVRAIGIHLGGRQTWMEEEFNNGQDTTAAGYGGIEVQLPLRIYAVGEIQTKDKDIGQTEQPYAYGLQWRAAGIAISTAMIQDGTFDEASFFFGIGFADTM